MIDMSKSYETRDGRKVRILCVDAPGIYPVKGYTYDGNSSKAHEWLSDGQYHLYVEQESDLIEVPVEKDEPLKNKRLEFDCYNREPLPKNQINGFFLYDDVVSAVQWLKKKIYETWREEGGYLDSQIYDYIDVAFADVKKKWKRG